MPRFIFYLFISFTVDKKLQISNLKSKAQAGIADSYKNLLIYLR